MLFISSIAGCRPVFNPAPEVLENQQQPQEKSPLVQEGNTKSIAEGQLLPNSTLEKQQELVLSKSQAGTERRHLLRNRVSPAFSCNASACNRTGVSFSFSKKVHLKLESSASVFSENVEEACDFTASSRHRAKQNPEDCHACMHLSDERKTSVQKRLNTLQNHSESIMPCVRSVRNRMLKENDPHADRKQVEPHLSFCSNKRYPPDLNCAVSPGVVKERRDSNETKKILGRVCSPPYPTSNVCMQPNSHKNSDVLTPAQESGFSAQPSFQQKHSCEASYSPRLFKASESSDCSKAVSAKTETPGGDALLRGIKPSMLPFLHVLSKDGSTALQWPTELLLFTKTEPSISYGCNPLYFDFRLSLSHSDSGLHEVNTERCEERLKITDYDGNEVSGLTENKQLSDECDNQSLKPKKKKRALSLKKFQPQLDSDSANAMHQRLPKYISEDLNENIPKVPTHLDCSQVHHTRATPPHMKMHVRSLAQHLQNCEQTLQDEVAKSLCIYPLVSRTKRQNCVRCDLLCSQRHNSLDLATYSRDISEKAKGSILGYKLHSSGKCLESKSNESFAGCWAVSSSQKSSSDRQSNYSDTSVISATSYASSYCSRRSSDRSKNLLPFCCKRKQNPVERQKCKHKKHNCISSSSDAFQNCLLFNNTTQRTRNCIQRHTVKYQRHSRYRHLLHGEISKKCRNKYSMDKHSWSNSSSNVSSHQDSGSSERSLSGTKSGSLAKQSAYNCWINHRENMKANRNTVEPGKSDCSSVRCPFKHVGICSSTKCLGSKEMGLRKAFTAKLLLEKVNSKKNQEQIQNLERFTSTGQVDTLPSQSSPLPEKAFNSHSKSVWNIETSMPESNAGKEQVETSAINNVTLAASTSNYSNCVLKDLMHRGASFQALTMGKDTAIKQQSNLIIGEIQPFLQSCEPVTNDFSGAFPSNRYSAVPHSTETKEEHDISGNGNFNSYPDSAMHKNSETEHKTEVYSKYVSSPLTQQPITFSPDEIEKYRFLQLQAQQHMQKQHVAKHLKVLPGTVTGPAAFSALPAIHSFPFPLQQHATVATLHHTLLQSFALSAAVHPHSSHLSLAHLHPFSQAHFAPISLSPFTQAFVPTHSTLLAGHPLHLVSATAIHPSHLAIPPLPPAAFIPTLFTPQLNAAAASSSMHLNPLIHPLFQGQELQHQS